MSQFKANGGIASDQSNGEIPLQDFPVGMEFDVSYPSFNVSLVLVSTSRLKFEIKEGPFARVEEVAIHVVPLGNSLFAVSWQEKDGATVTNVQDYDRGLIHSHAALPGGEFLRMTGTFAVTRPSDRVGDRRPHRNKVLVTEAMKALFQLRDSSAFERYYSPDYIQHNPGIPQGRDALKSLVAGLSKNVFYEPGMVLAEGDMVAIHGRIRGWADRSQIVFDLFRVTNGKLAEHWDVLQDEVSVTDAIAGIAMFDPEEGTRRD